jgi:hypothetical protein
VRQPLIARDEGVRVQLGQGRVLGVARVRPTELVRDPPGRPAGRGREEADTELPHVVEPPFGVLRQLATADRTVEERQRLRAEQRRSQELVLGADETSP